MKICMIGLGSIGKRHVRNLVKVLEKRKMKYQIDALRNSGSELQGDIGKIICHQYYSFEDLHNDYDVIFITNPTVYHYNTIKKASDKTKHMFIEKPVFDSLDYDLNSLSLRKDAVYYVACPLRHKSILKYLKKTVIEKGEIVSARIISTSYLPAWRKDADYRTVYSAKKNMGGGVTLDLIHEWDYARYLFGNPSKIMHMKSHMSGLDIDSDDISVYIARYCNMFLEIHLDYIGQKTERILQIFTNKKRIDADLISNTISEYENNELTEKKTFPIEDFYINEMEYFIDCVEQKKPNINTIQNAYMTLKIALTEE